MTTSQLVAHLEALENPEARRIVAEYRAQRSRDALVRSQRDRYRLLRTLRGQAETAYEQAQPDLHQRMVRLERQIEAANARHGMLLSETEVQAIFHHNHEAPGEE